MQGTIKKLMLDKGWGFITGPQGVEYFFHHTGCLTRFDTLEEGQTVQFEAGEAKGGKGPRAEGVHAVGAAR